MAKQILQVVVLVHV